MPFIPFLSRGNRTLKLSGVIRDKLPTTSAVKIISGFLSPKGFKQLVGVSSNEIGRNASKIEYIVVGRLTLPCAEIFDKLHGMPEYSGKLFVNLGLGVSTRNNKRIRWQTPLIHSKIIALDPASDNNLFYIGSANITHFALDDKNAEAGVVLEGLNESDRSKIESYMDNLQNSTKTPSTVPYDPSMRKSWIYLSNIGRGYQIEQSGRIGMPILVIACINNRPNIQPEIDDVLYADLPSSLPSRIIDIHWGRNRKIIFLLFPSCAAILKNDFSTVEPVFAEVKSINDIRGANRSIAGRVDGLLLYSQSKPTILDLREQEAPRDNPPDYYFQMKCRVISQTRLPASIQDLVDPGPDEKFPQLRKLVVKKGTPEFTFKLGKEFEGTPEEKTYAEIFEFRMKGSHSTFSDVMSEISLMKFDEERLRKTEDEVKRLLEKLPKSIEYYPVVLGAYEDGLSDISDQIKMIERKMNLLHCFIFKSSYLAA